jgi:hypothetical protein
MINKTLGAPLGGTIRRSQQGFESFACSLITPPNGFGGSGSCLESGNMVAAGEQASGAFCANDPLAAMKAKDNPVRTMQRIRAVYGFLIRPPLLKDS